MWVSKGALTLYFVKDLKQRLIPAIIGIAVAITLLQWSWGFALLIVVAMVGCGREAYNLNAALVPDKGHKTGLAIIHFGMFAWALFHLSVKVWPEYITNTGLQQIYSITCVIYLI